MKLSMVLLFIVAGLQVIASGIQLLGDQSKIFEGDTGVAWDELVQTYPTVAAQFTSANQGALIANIALGLLALLVIQFAFRDGQAWSWYALWIVPLSMFPGVINLGKSESPLWIPLFGGVLVLLAVVGLLLSYRNIFSN